jgi:hypothetical protein
MAQSTGQSMEWQFSRQKGNIDSPISASLLAQASLYDLAQFVSSLGDDLGLLQTTALV